MVDISHDKAVSILKATSERVLLRIEKNAISRSSQPISTDEDEVWFLFIMLSQNYLWSIFSPIW